MGISGLKTRDTTVKLKDIGIDLSYQRGANQATVKSIVNNFCEILFRRPVVARREDGSMWADDGGQRVRGGLNLGRRQIEVSVFKSTGPQMEAEVFLALNTASMKPPQPIDHFRAGVCAKLSLYVGVDRVANSNGFYIPYKQINKPSSSMLNCPKALIWTYEVDDGVALDLILGVINKAWSASAADLEKACGEAFIKGFGLLLQRYPGIKKGRLSQVLARVTPTTIKKKSNSQADNGWSRYKAIAYQIGILYNSNLAKTSSVRLKNLETLN